MNDALRRASTSGERFTDGFANLFRAAVAIPCAFASGLSTLAAKVAMCICAASSCRPLAINHLFKPLAFSFGASGIGGLVAVGTVRMRNASLTISLVIFGAIGFEVGFGGDDIVWLLCKS